MTLLHGDPVTQLAFSVYENKGVFAVLLGSGLSRSADIPTGWEITLDLVRRVAMAQGVEEQSDWGKWYHEKFGKEANYSSLLGEIGSSPDERRAILHHYIEPTDDDREEGKKIPTKAHHAIAQLVRSGHIRVIITTNFDRLMENALREQGVEPTVVWSVDSLTGAEPLTHSRCYLLKLHGDYKDARILNTEQELSEYPERLNQLLDRIFDEHGLIICGWSGEWDHALRAAFLRAPNRRYPVYWSARGALGDGASELVSQRSAKPIAISGADEFFALLQQRVETLDLSRRQNPLSIELLLNSAKRLLSKPEYRIQLDELFTQEADRLLEQLESDDFNPNHPWSAKDFQSRVQLYEAVTEPLARMAGILGRWGSDTELDLVLDLLRGLYHQAEKVGSGLTNYIYIRSYPAVLVFTAYGIGLTRSKRWKTLYKLFNARIGSERGDSTRVISTLFLSSWRGGDKNIWKFLADMQNRKTPLSDHLLEVMTDWKKGFAGVEANFELLFDRFEILGALASLDENETSQLEDALKRAENGNILAYMPVGRAGWSRSSWRTVQQELQQESFILELLDAGFARNSKRFVELFVSNFNIFASRMSWS